MPSTTISILPRIPRVVQVGDQLIADVVTATGATVTMRIDAADLFGGVAAALRTLAIAVDGLTSQVLTLDPSAGIASDGAGNVTHTGKLVTFAGPLALQGLTDVSAGAAPEPAPGSKQVFVEGGFVKCAT